MQKMMQLSVALMIGLWLGSTAYASSVISLASSMDPAGGLTENAVTGSQARINLGTGLPGDNDGLYDINNSATPFGAIDLFPSEAAFSVGSITVDAGAVSGFGVEVAAVTAIDLSGLWASGSATTDISDAALDLWLFEVPNSFTFSALDVADTATFTNGVLTSIDVSLDAQYNSFDGASNPITWNGTFSISGDTLALTFNDTQNFDTGFFGVVPSTFTSDLTGTVNAVGNYVIPEPATMTLLALGMGAVMRRRA